ncbi:MAG: pantothenate kinase [Candidatus Marinimicrobia bacterium CG08_land_8_20_14_0_20_45_22]|nr:MAG: pantothenate kinase [Candidatus Marinimicrobia bacterium CG08_land_8_20_14_0_20_45_22]
MILVADIGNTNITFGVFEGKNLLNFWRLNTSHSRTCDEYWLDINLLCRDAQYDIRRVEAIVIASVVPDLTQTFKEMTTKYLKVEAMIVAPTLDLGLKLLVDEPNQLGADRLCDIVAAKALLSCPLVVIDVGTATTFDVLDANGNYIGGAIAPGLVIAATNLVQKAAQLYGVEITAPEHIIGKNTREHMQSGIFIGHIAMIEGMIERIRSEMAVDSLSILITGGFCDEITHHSKIITHTDRLLTLKGIRLIWERNRNS